MLTIHDLTHVYPNGTRALESVTLEVPRGMFGLLGANGAGKSTTVKILTGLLSPFEGEARVAGLDPRRDPVAVKRRIGYVPENAVLFETMTVAELLLLVGRLRGISEPVIRARAEEFLAVFDLEGRLGHRIATLSKGMRQKVLLTSALMHDPEVLFLDEPLSGLDAGATILVKELVRRLAARGRTIFYCSHVLDVVERVCDRIAIVDQGRIVAAGTLEELAAQRGTASLERILTSVTQADDEGSRVERLVRALERSDG